MREAALILASDQGSLSRGGWIEKEAGNRINLPLKGGLERAECIGFLISVFFAFIVALQYVNNDSLQSVAFPRKDESET
ncbi:MAG: hypothetical protein ABSG73_04440 [Candidatus Aminicenantales bacterium]|jgi:hypothetical protein